MAHVRQVIAAIGFTAIVLMAAKAAEQPTIAFNGTFWKAMNADQQVFYIHGYMDGVTDGPPYGAKTSWLAMLQRKNGKSPTVGEIAEAIDVFYSQTEHLPICLNDAAFAEWRSLAGHPLDSATIGYMEEDDGEIGCQ